MKAERIGALLLEQGKITPGELALGLSVQKAGTDHQKLGDIFCQYGFVSEQVLLSVLAQQSGWAVFDGELAADMDMAEKLGRDFLFRHGIFPLKAQTPSFVLADPYDTKATDHLLELYGDKTVFFISAKSRVVRALCALMPQEPQDIPGHEASSVRDEADLLLEEAMMLGATDIHIEPSAKAVEVRLRVDGVLRFHRAFPCKDGARLVNVFFNRAEISAGDFLRFHDARFDHAAGHKKVDVRLSHIPSIHGSSLVLRLLDKDRSVVSLKNLGYAPEHAEIMERALQRPHGITLLTGPTGCGKTTSLYAMLGQLKDVGIKIVSVEDPVEVKLPLVTQVPVDIRKGHDFHQVARAFLRHDPDIMLIGEIRDEKTAAEAVRAAITGHRVFSTLHTHDAAGAILRLRNLGVDYSYMASTLVCIVAQRLVRKLCPCCRKEEFVTPLSVPSAQRPFITAPGMVVFQANRKGCAQCFEGFAGRTVIAEVLLIDDEIRFLIEQGLVNEVFLKVKEKKDFLSMRRDAARLVREGVIPLDEAVRVVG